MTLNSIFCFVRVRLLIYCIIIAFFFLFRLISLGQINLEIVTVKYHSGVFRIQNAVCIYKLLLILVKFINYIIILYFFNFLYDYTIIVFGSFPINLSNNNHLFKRLRAFNN